MPLGYSRVAVRLIVGTRFPSVFNCLFVSLSPLHLNRLNFLISNNILFKLSVLYITILTCVLKTTVGPVSPNLCAINERNTLCVD